MSTGTHTLTTRAQVLALQDVDFLVSFREPTCPSVVGQHLGLPANLTHYRVKRLVQLGLLKRSGRDGRRHLYCLSAYIFTYPVHLLLAEDRGYMGRLFTQLHQRLTVPTAEYANEQVSVSFNGVPTPTLSASPLPPHAPASMTLDTLVVRPERMNELMQRLRAILEEYGTDPTGSTYTVVMLHFKGELND